ncbi:DnaB-like helicase N-terminal domain-containing protein, partial [Sporichthya polymorpha]|uniref:DnaB-like helicase N-terminal domain-containing protein n=1 Tax=Sporichthya polymorpha TaxID=35751 RepID=UPI000525516D
MKAVPLAEDATLGVLFAAPESPARHAVLRWLRPEDFAGPWHGEVYRTIRSLASAGDCVDPEAVGLALMRRVGPTRAEVVRVAGLLRAAPPNAHPDTYAR